MTTNQQPTTYHYAYDINGGACLGRTVRRFTSIEERNAWIREGSRHAIPELHPAALVLRLQPDRDALTVDRDCSHDDCIRAIFARANP